MQCKAGAGGYYYHAFYWAARHARRSILISGWEFDRGVPLLRGADATAGAEVRLLKFLNGLRLPRHGPPTAAQRKLLAVLDPDALPFDSDGREPADEHSVRTPRMVLRRAGAALWDRVARGRRSAA